MSIASLPTAFKNLLSLTHSNHRLPRVARIRPRPQHLVFESLEQRTLLSVDPSWLITMGAEQHAIVRSVAVAPNGDVVASIDFSGTIDVDPGPASVEFTAADGGSDIIMARYSSSGALIWARHYDSFGFDKAHAVAMDAADNIYVTGLFIDSLDFSGDGIPDVVHDLDAGGRHDLFVLKLDGSGTMQWATSAQGDGDEQAYGISLDTDGNVFIAGTIGGATTMTFGDLSIGGLESGRSIVSKLDVNGNFLWVNLIDGPGAVALDIAAGSDGSAHVAGYGAADFGNDADGTRVTLADSGAFVAKYDSSGVVQWAQSLSGLSSGRGVTVDASGSVYVVGSGGAAKLQSDGTPIVNATLEGFTGRSVALGAGGTVYVAGDVAAETTIAGQRLVGLGGIVAELDADLSLLWLQRFDATPKDVVEDTGGNVYVGGAFRGSARFPTGEVFTSVVPEKGDAFLLKWNPDLPVINGNVFADTNGDGVNNDTNRAMPTDWAVYLDGNANGQRDPGETFTTGDRNGNYGFGNVPAGTYTIAQDVQSGWTQTLPIDGVGDPVSFEATLAVGDFATPYNFAATTPTTTVTYNSTDVPKKFKVHDVMISTLTIPSLGSGTRIFDVNVSVDYADPSDDNKTVAIDLVDPSGVSIMLHPFGFTGVGGMNVYSEFDDESSGVGSRVPGEPLSTFDGLGIAGDWQLHTDLQSHGKMPTLENWSLTITYATPPAQPGPPTIDSLGANPDPVILGNDLTLTTGGVSDPDGTVVSVAFYRDANGNGVLDVGTDQLLANDTDGSDGWSAAVPTTGFQLGTNTYFAQATDNDALTSAPVSTTGQVVDTMGNEIYASAIAFDSRLRGKGGSKHDERIVVTVRNDADANGADLSDPLLAGALVTVTISGPDSSLPATLSGVTDSLGVFTSTWLTDLLDGTYTATIDSISLGGFVWNPSLGTNVTTHIISHAAAASQQFAMAAPLEEPTGSSDTEPERRSRRGARDELFSRFDRADRRQHRAQRAASAPLRRLQATAIDRAMTDLPNLPRLARRSRR